MKSPYKTISSKIVYENPWICVHEDAIVRPDGSSGIYGYVESNDSIMVAAMNEKNEIFFVHNFSYPAQKWHWEMVGGGGKPGTDLLDTAKAELAEEAGFTASVWQKLGVTRTNDGLLTEKVTTYIARDLMPCQKPLADDSDIIDDGKFFDFATITRMIKAGEIDEGTSITALYFVREYLGKNL